jgi:hypothetical protein
LTKQFQLSAVAIEKGGGVFFEKKRKKKRIKQKEISKTTPCDTKKIP